MACSRNRAIAASLHPRYKAILVNAESYLLELTRYVVLNPVRAHLVPSRARRSWRSYRAVTGEVDAPAWLETDGLLAQFGTRRARAVAAYEKSALEGTGGGSIWKYLNRQVLVGDDDFIAQEHERAGWRPADINNPRAQRRPPAPPLDVMPTTDPDRDTAMCAA